MRYFVESGCSLDDASALMPHGRALGSTRSGPRSLDASRSLMASGSTPLMPQGSAAASALFKAVAPRHQQQERPHLTYARRPRLTLVLDAFGVSVPSSPDAFASTYAFVSPL